MRTALAFFLTLLVGSRLSAQAPDPKAYSPAKYTVCESRGHMAAMRDGIKLSVDVYRPCKDGKAPAVLIHTPYNNNASGWVERARKFARRGYAVAISDCRGRFDSEGVWDPFGAKHKTDGYDLIEWLAKQPWCDGNVGMMGQSYMGWTQWWTATQAPPSLKAIVPEVAPPDQLYNGPYQNGILVCWMMDWAASHAGRTTQIVRSGPYGGFAVNRQKDFMELPYLKLLSRRGALDAPWFETWIRENLSTSPYWRGISYQTPESYGKVNVPSLNVTGWFDANHPGTPKNFTAMKKFGATPDARRPHMVIGPWMHSWNTTRKLSGIDFGPDAIIDWDGYVCRWLDRYLKGEKNGVENDPPVHVFVMGRNCWHAEKDWPLPQTKWTKFYLHSGGKANSLHGDGTLSTTAPGKEPADTYTHDPANPVPESFTNGHIDGPIDTRKGAGRKDVLVYSTPPLAEEVEVTGPIEAKLFAATSARDTDWMMRLIDVHPNGYCALLCDGVLRARCRDPKNHGAFSAERLSEIEPDKVYEYTLAFWRGTGNVFGKGHRIRIEVSSTFFPYYLPNPGTGEDNVGLQTRRVVANQRIVHDAAHPSHVLLPIIPARKQLPGQAIEPIPFQHARVTDAWVAYSGKLTFGKGQTLAILDDGCNLSLPEWSQSAGPKVKVVAKYDSVDGDDNPKHEGRGYHGSTVGIPSSLNYKGKLGVAFNNQLAIVRALECCHCNLKDSQTLAAGLQWVIDNYAKYRITAVNLAPVDDLEHATPITTEIDGKLKRLRELGIWVSAPAGNHNFTKGISWPACQPYCFAIGAVQPGKDVVFLDRNAKIDLVVPASATSSSNAILCGAVLLLHEAIGKANYDWKKDGPTLAEAMMAIFQRTGVAVRDPATNLTFRRLDLKNALDEVFRGGKK